MTSADETLLRLSPKAFADEADRAFAALPEPFRGLAAEVVLQVAEWPDRETLDALGLVSRHDLLGLYHGISRDRRSVAASGDLPDVVFLYRQPILDFAWHEGESVAAVINHVLVHEIGHHFGLSDDDMEAIEEADEPGP
ncbi:MAG: hypothetical protein GC150_03515 [Rhizobiales bacterium]|nr:hypothetical protein [Hyphomicrobiales bacterium]